MAFNGYCNFTSLSSLMLSSTVNGNFTLKKLTTNHGQRIEKFTCICILFLYPLWLSESLALLCRPSSSPAMHVHSVSQTHILTEKCWDSEKHYVDFLTGYNNCSYKNIKKKWKSWTRIQTRSKVHKPCLAVKYTSLIRQALYTLV